MPAARPGPPPLEPFGLVLHRDASWTHEGAPITNRRLRERFDRAVRYLPDEQKYVVQIAHFRGQIEVEETGFFVRAFDDATGLVSLSDRSVEPLDCASLRTAESDGALVCTVKRDLVPEGLPARFLHGAHAALFNALDDSGSAISISGTLRPIPPL